MRLWPRREPPCQHDWKVIKSRYSPPAGRFKARGSSDWVIRSALHGQTTTTLRCRVCGDLATRESIGDARVPVEMPDDLL